jgi:anti-sigma B factor antagonist
MRVAQETLDSRTRVVSVTGELVGTSGARLVRTAGAALDESAGRLIVDLSAMTFMDSGGLAALIATWSATVERGARFAVVLEPQSHAARSLELRGVAGVFAVAGTREEALALVAGEE